MVRALRSTEERDKSTGRGSDKALVGEIGLIQPSQVRLSPANTRLSEVSKETVIRYLKELSDKYTLGVVIADVPSNKTGPNKDIFELTETMFCMDR